MYTGTPHTIIDSLPALMNNIKMMHTIARYYNTPERMTTLFCKVTNQMITNCKQYVLTPGQLWNQVRAPSPSPFVLTVKFLGTRCLQWLVSYERMYVLRSKYWHLEGRSFLLGW